MQSSEPAMSDRAAAASGRFSQATLWAAALGLLLRCYHYGRNPSMWHDEAATSVNVLRKGFAGLFGHLDHSATGPSLLLAMQKCLVFLLGDSTRSLRLISFLASCFALVLFVRLSTRLLEPSAAFCATVLAACSDRLLWHASEARHYSSDFLFAVIFLFLFVKTARWSLTERLGAFAVFAPFAILLSYPGIFLCGGLMLALLVEMRGERNVSAWMGWALLGAWMLAWFSIFYFFTIKPQRSAAMDAAWANTFPDLNKPWKLPLWAIIKTISIFDYFVRPCLGGLLIVPAVAGTVAFWKVKMRGLVVLVVAPMIFAMLLALIKGYPYTGARTMVYAMPGLAMLASAGLSPTVSWLRRRFPPLLASVLILALFLPIGGAFVSSIYRVVAPWSRADAAGASAYVLAHRLPHDPVTGNSWNDEYYFRNLGGEYFPELNFFHSPVATNSNRVWLVLASGAEEDRLRIARDVIGRHWRVAETRNFQNTTVFLLFSTAQN